jgi:hypothetical protein
MSNIIIFFSAFYILLLSVVGYGMFFQNLCFGGIRNMNDPKVIYIGFYGLFAITLVSIISSLLVPHNFTHNILLHFTGVLFFIFTKIKNKKNYFKTIFLISIAVFSALLISKTHDDFSYYHLPFTKYLTEQKVIFGMGILGHGYKLLSSLFFLNSSFYLPLVGYFSFHFSLLFFLIFFNFFLLKEIIHKGTHEVIKFLYLFAFIFFNLSFNRIAEFGTDKVGQLLIVILTIKIFQHICYDDNRFKLKNILLLLPLLGFCISLKTYFLPYILIGLTIVLLDSKLIKNVKTIFYSRSFCFLFIFLLIYFFHHFISTGCIVSPLSFTCFGDNLYWADGSQEYKDLAIWLEQWSKAGAGPSFQVNDPLVYIQNFNWFSRWIDEYFLGKVSDQLGLLTLVFLTAFLLFKNFKSNSKMFIIDKKVLFFYLIILVIFFIWFLKHPQLRYGGYSIVFLTLSIPIALIYQRVKNKTFFNKNLKYLIILIVIVFNIKNINRINNEFQRTDLYKFDNFPFFSIPEKEFISEKSSSGLIFYRTNGHCWNTPSPCVGHLSGKLQIKKDNGYYFFYR